MCDRLQKKRWIFFLLLAIATFAFCFLPFAFELTSIKAQDVSEAKLPSAQVHVLPTSLEQWNDVSDRGDYFDRIASTPLGYLIWSEFPVKVYIEKPIMTGDRSAKNIRSERWLESVTEAVKEWNDYLPLMNIENPELADITIKRSSPLINARIDPKTGLFEIPRARTAQTHYQFYLKSDRQKKLVSQRMIIEISPDRGDRVIKAAVRHELGHALGIWGHSPNSNDALYFSATSDPPSISVRDINTLKKIYQHSTKLGWAIDLSRK
jgi:predicted Zn-dependent protease